MLLNRERALATMEKYDLEALVATSAENVYYLSDYFTEHLYHFAPGGFAGAVLPRDPDKPATLIIQEWELPQLTEKPTWMPQTRVLTGFDVYAPEGAELGPSETKLLEAFTTGAATKPTLTARVAVGPVQLAYLPPEVPDTLILQELKP